MEKSRLLYGEIGNLIIIRIAGKGTWEESKIFLDFCKKKLDEKKQLAVDLSACKLLDSTFLGSIAYLALRTNKIDIFSPSPEVTRAIKVLGLEKIIKEVRVPGKVSEKKKIDKEKLSLDEQAKMILLAHKSLIKVTSGNLPKFKDLIETVEKEIGLPRQVDREMQPLPIPRIGGFEISALGRPSFNVGGDFFDVFPLPGKRWGIVVADVAGKGFPASLIIDVLRDSLKHCPDSVKESPRKCVEMVNKRIYDETDENIFVSLSYLVLAPQKSQFSFINAGGETPLVYRKRLKDIEELSGNGRMVGLCRDWQDGETRDLKLDSGDMLFLYTDGLIEVLNPKEEIYGDERIRAFLKKKGGLPADDFLKNLEGDIKDFSYDQPLYDDLTLLAIKKK